MESNKKLLFMSTSFRSGSALMSRIVNGHSKVSFSADKIKYFNYCFERYSPLNIESTKKMLKDLNVRTSARFDFPLDEEKCLSMIGSDFTYENIYRCVMENYFSFESGGSEYIGECENLSWTKIPFVLEKFPDSKALLIVRDPHDCCVSFKKITFSPGDNYLISVLNSLGKMKAFLKYQEKYGDRFLGIKFEDLKGDMKGTTEKIFSFLGLEFEQETLDESNWLELHGGGWRPWENHATSAFEDTKKKSSSSPVFRWKQTGMDEVDQFIVEWLGKDILPKFGYSIEMAMPPKQEVFDEAMKRLNSSELLRNALKNVLTDGTFSEDFPLNPLKPENWDKNYIAKPELLNV